jgi:hypothetical protein
MFAAEFLQNLYLSLIFWEKSKLPKIYRNRVAAVFGGEKLGGEKLRRRWVGGNARLFSVR